MKIPNLRFPEFSGEWEEVKLGKIATFFSGGTPTSSNKRYYDGSIPFIGSGKISANSVDQYITQEALKNSSAKLVKKGDLLYALYGATSGEVAISKLDGAINQAVLCIRSQEETYFLLQWLLLNKESILNTYLQGGQGNLSAQIIKSLILNIPKIPEQQKIATFLTAIDTKIDQITKKQTLLKQYKKGVMQKLFSQELRFKADNGSEFSEWEEKRFGEIFSFRTTNSFSRDNLNYDDGEIKNIHYGDIHTKFATLFNVTNELVPFVNSEIELKRIAEDNYCKEGDLIIADASEDYEDVGKSIEIVNLNGEKVLAGLHTILARPDLHNMSIGFNGYLMKSEKIRLQIKTIAQGSKVLSISSKRLAVLTLVIPQIPEQEKIANFLTNIDIKIDLATKQLDTTKQFKKALLQQMFV